MASRQRKTTYQQIAIASNLDAEQVKSACISLNIDSGNIGSQLDDAIAAFQISEETDFQIFVENYFSQQQQNSIPESTPDISEEEFEALPIDWRYCLETGIDTEAAPNTAQGIFRQAAGIGREIGDEAALHSVSVAHRALHENLIRGTSGGKQQDEEQPPKGFPPSMTLESILKPSPPPQRLALGGSKQPRRQLSGKS